MSQRKQPPKARKASPKPVGSPTMRASPEPAAVSLAGEGEGEGEGEGVAGDAAQTVSAQDSTTQAQEWNMSPCSNAWAHTHRPLGVHSTNDSLETIQAMQLWSRPICTIRK